MKNIRQYLYRDQRASLLFVIYMWEAARYIFEGLLNKSYDVPFGGDDDPLCNAILVGIRNLIKVTATDGMATGSIVRANWNLDSLQEKTVLQSGDGPDRIITSVLLFVLGAKLSNNTLARLRARKDEGSRDIVKVYDDLSETFELVDRNPAPYVSEESFYLLPGGDFVGGAPSYHPGDDGAFSRPPAREGRPGSRPGPSRDDRGDSSPSGDDGSPGRGGGRRPSEYGGSRRHSESDELLVPDARRDGPGGQEQGSPRNAGGRANQGGYTRYGEEAHHTRMRYTEEGNVAAQYRRAPDGTEYGGKAPRPEPIENPSGTRRLGSQTPTRLGQNRVPRERMDEGGYSGGQTPERDDRFDRNQRSDARDGARGNRQQTSYDEERSLLVTRQDASGWDTARQSGRSEDGRRDYDRLGGRNDGCGDSSRGNAGRRGDSSPSRGDDRLGGRNDGRGDSSRGNAGRRGYDQNGLPLVTSQISMTVDGRAFPVNNKLRVVVDGKVVPVEQNLTIHTQ